MPATFTGKVLPNRRESYALIVFLVRALLDAQNYLGDVLERFSFAEKTRHRLVRALADFAPLQTYWRHGISGFRTSCIAGAFARSAISRIVLTTPVLAI